MHSAWALIDDLMRKSAAFGQVDKPQQTLRAMPTIDVEYIKTAKDKLADALDAVAQAILAKKAAASDDGTAIDKMLKDVFIGEDINMDELKLREAIKHRIQSLGMMQAPS